MLGLLEKIKTINTIYFELRTSGNAPGFTYTFTYLHSMDYLTFDLKDITKSEECKDGRFFKIRRKMIARKAVFNILFPKEKNPDCPKL